MNRFDKLIYKIGMDKLVHACVCGLITFMVALTDAAFSENDAWICAAIGGLTAFFVGVLKELLDFFCGKLFDVEDLLADFIGAVFGFVIVGLLLMAIL